jgi:hypothetical protein
VPATSAYLACGIVASRSAAPSAETTSESWPRTSSTGIRTAAAAARIRAVSRSISAQSGCSIIFGSQCQCQRPSSASLTFFRIPSGLTGLTRCGWYARTASAASASEPKPSGALRMNSKMRREPVRSILGTESTRTSARSAAGCSPAIMSPVSPPSEAPMITGGSPIASITRSTSSAIASTRYRPSAARPLSPWPRKSIATAVQPSAASVGPASPHECLVWPPPCSSRTTPRDGPSGVQRSPASRPAPPSKSSALCV